MPSLVHSLREQLTALGEYVVLANIASGWFAIFESTLEAQTKIANRNGRAGPNLIIYRTRNQDGEPRDHYVVPYALFQTLVTDATVAEAKVKSSRRWNLTLKQDRLRVTHGVGSEDIATYYSAPLLLEGDIRVTPAATTRELVTFQAMEALEGLAREYRVVSRARSAVLRATALKASGGICEACRVDFSTLLGGLGARALQVHHKNQLAQAESEIVTRLEDLAVLCANCHSLVHAAVGLPMPVEELQALWRRNHSDASQVTRSK